MNTLIKSFLLLLAAILTFVICDRSADVQCLQTKSAALEGLSDDQLYNLTQQNLQIGEQMVLKRAAIANQSGLTCYQQFYDVFTQGLRTILAIPGEQQRLDAAKSPEERSAAIKDVAELTQAIRCDEDWRAIHSNETVKSAQCSSLDVLTSPLDLAKFESKLALLKGGMGVGGLGLKLNNNVMSGITGEMLNLYSNAFSVGEKCSESQSTPVAKCSNIKMLISELDRVFYLFGLVVQSKL